MIKLQHFQDGLLKAHLPLMHSYCVTCKLYKRGEPKYQISSLPRLEYKINILKNRFQSLKGNKIVVTLIKVAQACPLICMGIDPNYCDCMNEMFIVRLFCTFERPIGASF